MLAISSLCYFLIRSFLLVEGLVSFYEYTSIFFSVSSQDFCYWSEVKLIFQKAVGGSLGS